MPERLIDLSFSIHEGMTSYPGPWHPITEITQLGRMGIEGRVSSKITFGSHSGTHVDGASHFLEGGQTVDEIPLETLVGPARVVKFPDCEPNKKITVDDIQAQVGDAHGIERILFRYDWSDHWGDISYYTGSPHLSTEACEYLRDCGVKLIGQDGPSPDDPKDSPATDNDSPVHKIMLAAGIINVEYLTNMRQIQSDTVQFIALPLKIQGGDGSPARCIAIETTA
jgi:arylformamidase